MDSNQGQNQVSEDKSLFTVIDRFALNLVKQNFQRQIAEIENQFKVSITIIEEYGQVLIKRTSDEVSTPELEKELFQQVGYKVLELTIIQSSKLKEGKIDSNSEFYLKIEKNLKKKYESLNRKQDYEISLQTNDIDQNFSSSKKYKPLVLKSLNIKGKFVVKICKIEQPENLNFDKIDVVVLNMTKTGIYLDEFGYQLVKSNNQLNLLLKSLKQQIQHSDYIDEKVFLVGSKNISLIIQFEDNEDACINRLLQILDKLKDQKFQQKGNLRIFIGWRPCCGQKYFETLYKYLEKLDSSKTYLQFPTEICLVTDEGLENQVLQVVQTVQFNQTVSGKIEMKKEVLWNINTEKYPRFVDQNVQLPGIVLGKELTEMIEKATELKQEEFYCALKLDGQEKQFFQTPKELGMNPEIVDRLKLNLKALKETNLSQSCTNQILNQCDFYYYLHPYEEDYKMYPEDVQNVIRSYVKLGFFELRLERDSCTMDIITPIFKINIKQLTMQQIQGNKKLVYLKRQEKQVQVMNTEQKQAYDEIMKINVLQFLQSDQAEKAQDLTLKSKPYIYVRAKPETYDEISQFITQLKLNSFVTHHIKINQQNLNTVVKQYLEQTSLIENVEISIVDDILLIYGFKKTLNRILPALMSKVCDSKYGEESVYAIPSFWEPQNNNHLLFSLSLNSVEAVKCINMFNQSMSNIVRKVYRIQNMNLWKNYQFEKETLLQKGNASERLLFHGPGVNVNPETIYTAIEEGFDFRNDSIQNGQIFGRGAHFHDQASKANQYAYITSGKRQIIIASVLIGKAFETSSNASYTKPPVITEGKEQRYDSVKSNNQEGNNTYAVYHNSKAYPYYLLEYD
ncbi:poly (ADP-ribose) polymerase family protein (macronuclear) [Tetrahymena thermophila SB210]|uniref:Poly [ADP-ribose] polymerase n=1 Tax=Tetrahymena thermophila (strain SB210) TaxID=312017 RepID=Q22SD0_TETTS|nr:poly (ADP-ribose) polymerase family protein [Tetrahymena thermophila SB210]EAR87842.2 poly (ADP-ribose) polymerase family protein [Tetrahymena thermophila SB210]|eukprot:XP_001008087.2 poly (ADP-ribose) polymerase family protein [Tetrahymena thermophila SB210]